MPVDAKDPAWGEHDTNRQKVADLFGGRDTAVGYVRGLPGWDQATLNLIREGAYFLPMVARTVEAFGGLVFAKPPTRSLPDGLSPYLDDITQTGQEIDRFAEQAMDGVMLTGAVMVLVDYPQGEGEVTRAMAEAEGRRPVLRLYDARSILSARITQFGSARRVSHVRVVETVEVVDPNDPFTIGAEQQVRVLDLVEGVYQQTLWRKRDGQWLADEPIIPRMNGKPLGMVPAFFSNTRDGEPTPAKPPMTDLADINVAHLNNSAQNEWALAWLGAPTLFAAGIDVGAGETIQMGASSAVIAADPKAKLEIVQADAAKFSGLKQAMDDKRRDGAAMGARMLLEPSRAAITAETARLERSAEASVVASMANAVSQCLTNALRLLAEWAGVRGEVQYWLNTDLMPTGLSQGEMADLLAAWTQGAISKRDLFAKLQEKQVIDGAKTFDEHEEEVAFDQNEPDDDAERAALGAV